MSTFIHIGGDVRIELEKLRTSHLLTQGASGSGKSYLIRVLAEQLCEHVQTIIIDPEGEFNTLRERYPFVLVGDGGETPAAVPTAELLARRLVEIGASAVCDLYSLEKSDQQEWVRVFLTAIMRLPRSMWKPMIIVIDESHLFCPEKGEGSAVSTKAVEDLCSRGRKHGIGIVLATQRIAKLSNNAASEMQNYLIGRTFMQADRERAAKVFGVPHRAAEMESFYRDLKILEPGQFWALGVAVSTERVMVSVRKALTTHPEAGALAIGLKPPTPDQVKDLLPQLADLPQEVEDERDQVDVLREQVEELSNSLRDEEVVSAGLRADLETRVKPVVVMPDFTGVREKLIAFERKGKLEQIEQQIEEACASVRRDFREIAEGIEADLQAIEAGQGAMRIEPMSQPPQNVPNVQIVQNVQHSVPTLPSSLDTEYLPPRRRSSNVTYVTSSGETAKLGGTAKKVAGILAGIYPKGIKRGILAAMCGVVDGGSFSARLSEVRSAGVLREENGLLYASPGGAAQYRGTFTPPRTTREVLDLWRPKLGRIPFGVLELLVHKRGQPVTRASAASSVGVVDGGSFSARLSELRSTGLMVDVDRGSIAANKEALFL